LPQNGSDKVEAESEGQDDRLRRRREGPETSPFLRGKAGMCNVSGARSRRGPDLRPADTTQGLNLERELHGPASQRQIFGFQTFDQVSVVAFFDWPAGLAGPRKLDNGSGFFAVRYADYTTH
jgi:hypothetical protein